MSPYEIASLIVAGAALIVALSWWAFDYRHRKQGRRDIEVEVTVVPPPTPEMLGTLDGQKEIPNNVTLVPFPTPAMEAIYEEGEEKRAEQESSHVIRLTTLEIRQKVLIERAKDLKQQIATGKPTAVAGNPARQKALVAESLAARYAAIETEKKNHEAQLKKLDAATQKKIDDYWAANLRARQRAPHEMTDLDTLPVPGPGQWRALRSSATSAPEANEDEAPAPVGDGRSELPGTGMTVQGHEPTTEADVLVAPGPKANGQGATTGSDAVSQAGTPGTGTNDRRDKPGSGSEHQDDTPGTEGD